MCIGDNTNYYKYQGTTEIMLWFSTKKLLLSGVGGVVEQNILGNHTKDLIRNSH